MLCNEVWRYVAYYMRQWSLFCHNLPKDEEDKEDNRHEKTLGKNALLEMSTPEAAFAGGTNVCDRLV